LDNGGGQVSGETEDVRFAGSGSVGLRDLAAGLLWKFWAVVPVLAILGLLLFPLYKAKAVGWIPVVLGGSLALGMKVVPARWITVATRAVYGGTDKTWLTVVCIATAVLRLPLILWPFEPHSDHMMYHTFGRSLAAGLGYSAKSLLFPPGQSAWLAVWIWLFGDNMHILVLAEVLLSIAAVPLFHAAIRDYSKPAARWAAAIAAFMPSLIVWSGTLGHETTVLFLEGVILLMLRKGDRLPGRERYGVWAGLGCVAGLTALIHPTFLAFPVMVGLALWLARLSVAVTLRRVVIIALCLGLTLAPWTIRNYVKFGGLCLVSTNMGRVMLSANHPNSDGIYFNTTYIGADLGTIEKDRLQRRLALQAIAGNPARFVSLMFKRLVYTWGTDTTILSYALGDNPSGSAAILYQALAAIIQIAWAWFVVAWAIGAFRAVRSFRGRSQLQCFCALWIALLWVAHLVLEGMSRHHLNLMPFIAMISFPAYWEWAVSKHGSAEALGLWSAGSGNASQT
jgi:4-amino-4-deoxy-L-arabinose transferase-like glycosyltransferase